MQDSIRSGPKKTNAIDQYLAGRLFAARSNAGVTQEHVANILGITYQQFQKYEAGKNRMAASTLVRIATVLGVQPAWFFEELELSTTEPMLLPPRVTAEQRDLIDDFKMIENPAIRAGLRRLIKAEAEAARERLECMA
jgi:transcriptional regulator with XRE-family HTH domain